MRQPLLSLKAKVDGVAEVIEKEKRELEDGVQTRKELMASRQVMELLMDTAQVAGKVEKLVCEVKESEDALTSRTTGSTAESTTAVTANDARGDNAATAATANLAILGVSIGHGRLLERIAGETAKLKYLCIKGRQIRFIANLTPRINAAELSLLRSLDACFESALRSESGREEEVIMHCLRAYAGLLASSSSPRDAVGGTNASKRAAAEEAVDGGAADGESRNLDEPASVHASKVLRCALTDEAISTIVHENLENVKTKSSGGGGDSSTSSLLAEMYASAFETAASRSAVLLRLANRELLSSSPRVIGHTILGGGILASIDELTAGAISPSWYSPGNPNRFVSGYRGALELVQAIESRYCATEDVLLAFRDSQYYERLLSRFNTQAYFTLRQREIVDRVRGAIDANTAETLSSAGVSAASAAPSGSAAVPTLSLQQRQLSKSSSRDDDSGSQTKQNTSGDGEFCLELTSVVNACLERCWEPDVFLPPLADKFLLLSLQIITRYQNWLVATLHIDLDSDDNLKEEVKAVASPASSSAPEISVPIGLDDLARVCHDVSRLCDRTDSTYTDSVFECVSALLDGEDSATELVAPSFSLSSEGGGRKDSGSADDGAGLSESISSSFKQVTDRLRACLPFIIVRLLATTIASRCTDVLRQLRGITATYRMTNKPPPTRPSPYTASILRPMMEFTDGPGFALLSRIAGFGDTLKAAVVEKVSHRFFVMADELIETVRKTESSLKKLKNRNAVGATSDSGSMSDTDKICRQLFLDVGEYARQAKEKLNVDVEKDSEAYASLARVVGGGGGENKGT